MNLFNRLPGFPRTPAGKERVVLRQLPKAFLLGTLLVAVPALLARLIASPDDALAVGNPVIIKKISKTNKQSFGETEKMSHS